MAKMVIFQVGSRWTYAIESMDSIRIPAKTGGSFVAPSWSQKGRRDLAIMARGQVLTWHTLKATKEAIREWHLSPLEIHRDPSMDC